MGLFEPIWMTRNSSKENKAREEIFKIKDVEKLKEIAIKAPLPSIKCAAAYNIEDDNVLKELYLDTTIEQSHFQMSLLDQIRDKNILNEIALIDAKKNDYYCAYKKVVDDEVLREIILDSNFKITSDNYGYNLLLKAIKAIDKVDDINRIIDTYSNNEDIVRLANNQKDRLEGVKAYIGLCPTCHKEIRYEVYWDVYDEKQREKSNYICGCSKCDIKLIGKNCEIEKVKHDLEGDYVQFCFNCGLSLEHEVKDHNKCMCGIGKYYIPVSIKIDKKDR